MLRGAQFERGLVFRRSLVSSIALIVRVGMLRLAAVRCAMHTKFVSAVGQRVMVIASRWGLVIFRV